MSIYLALPLVALVSNLGLAFMTVRGQWQATGQRAFAFFLVAMALITRRTIGWGRKQGVAADL